MRRFLDWTAAQTAGQLSSASSSVSPTPSNRRSSQHSQNQSAAHFMFHQTSLGGVSAAASSTSISCGNPARDLEMQHLSKLLHEIKYYQASSSPLPSAASSQNQQEFVDKVYKALPLFLNVFGSATSPPIATGAGTSGLATSSRGMFSLSAGSCQSSVDQLDNSHSESTTPSKPSSPLPQLNAPHMERFPDLLPFAFTIARLFVSEVRQRASNKHAEDASLSILKFLNMSTTTSTIPTVTNNPAADKTNLDQSNNQLSASKTVEGSQGWNLLLSLNALAKSQNQQIIQLLCDASLPSTLIKCLYLFFDLPAPSTKQIDSEGTNTDANNTPTASSSHIEHELTFAPLVKAFTQLLVQLCYNQSAIDELIRKDDLRLLIGIASSQCLRHNRQWRRTAFQTLLAISRNMRDNFMYLEQNLCIQVYVENMHRIHSLSLVTTEELIEMVRTLFEFLHNLDVNNRNQPRSIKPLTEQFNTSRIIDLIEELLLKIDSAITQDVRNSTPMEVTDIADQQSYSSVSQLPSVSSDGGLCIDEFRRCGRKLMHSITIMAKINTSQDAMTNLTTLKPLTTSRFEMFEQFKMPRPSAKNCILNYDALRLFKMAWSKCRDGHLVEAILDATISLFNDDKYNYFIFESQQLLVYYMTSNNFTLLPYKVKQKLFKFIEFIIIETNYIPCLELGTIGTIIKKNASLVDLTLGLKTLIACLRFNSKFSDIFREIGLLEVIVELLIQTMQQDKLSQSADKLEVLYLLLEASQYLLAGPNNSNCVQFNESGAARHVFNCLSKPEFFQLFVPVHSSSSDDSGVVGPSSRGNSPLPITRQTSYANQSQRSEGNLPQSKPSFKQLQKVAFTIIRQLILSSSGDEHLANLLGLLARNLEDLKSLDYKDRTSESNDADEISATQTARLNLNSLISQEVNLKICILKSLMIILKDSHRCRTLFRKAGGFIYIVASLDTLEGSLPSCEPLNIGETCQQSNWRMVNSRRVWRLIKNSLMTIVVAMRSEPANLHAFADDVLSKFTESLRKLGCFKANKKDLPVYRESITKHQDNFDTFKSIFLAPPARDFSTISEASISPDEACCQLFRFLYDMSLNLGDGTAELEVQLQRQGQLRVVHHQSNIDTKSMSFDQDTSSGCGSRESGMFKRRSQLQLAPKRPPSLDLNSTKNAEIVSLTFPCVIPTILDLIPSSPSEELMIFICFVVKSLLRHERNQQLLCEAGLISKLLSPSWRIAVTDRSHFMHELVLFMLEKLTKQSISAKELRMFLRLDEPLRCKNLDEILVTESYDETRQKLSESASNKDLTPIRKPRKEKITTERIETLVSMMSNDKTKIQPPFVEFDMSDDGFSSLFMPSIAPVNVKALPPNSSSFLNSTLDIHTNEKNGILGGVGTSERQFPPPNGLTFSTWICIEKFPGRSSDSSHNLRLLTIYRGSASTGKEYSCFRIQISALDRALTVSTQEALLFDNDSRLDAQLDPDCNLRIWTPELILEGVWHHIAVTINRMSTKQSNINVFVDGVLVHHQRICYINAFVGSTNSGPLGNLPASNNASSSAAAYVNAFIGSLPQFRTQLKTQWKQGPCHLIEEPLSASFISVIYSLTPNFIGNFQCPHKLNEFAKTKIGQVNFNVKYHPQSGQTDTPSHRPLVHQQSAAVVNSSHGHGGQLTRVASSNVNSSPHTAHNPSSSNQFCISEDRVLISIDARATSLMTLSRMRRIYTRFDCRQVSRVLGLALHENSIPILLMHNTGVHLNGPSRGVGAITIGYNRIRYFVPNTTQDALINLGGAYILLGLIAQSQTIESLLVSYKALVCALKHSTQLQAQMDNINGYQILSVFFWKKKHLLNPEILKLTFSLITNNKRATHPVYGTTQESEFTSGIQQVGALRELICECFDLWLQTDMLNYVLEFIHDLICSTSQERGNNLPSLSNNLRVKNLKCLRDMDLLPRMLRLLPQYNSQQFDSNVLVSNCDVKSYLEDKSHILEDSRSFDIKAVYLIKQTVFELLNRTPRQSDILYFGQFLASLLPSKNKERSIQTVSLRNILLKSLLQMLTKNKQKEINYAMQEELVRILGFDWFMLFISGPHLNEETINLGFLNLMIVLSNDELYSSFKSKSPTSFTNGGWLKEPIFPTIDGKFNIQLLGINVGVFFGLSGKRKSIRQQVLEAPNFFLLCNFLSNLVDMPRIYLMIFQTMTNTFAKLDLTVLDTIERFDKLNLDLLCDCLVGDTHHKRRKTLTSIEFKHHELVVCLVYMLRDIIWQCEAHCDDNIPTTKEPTSESITSGDKTLPYFEYPNDVTKFLMYLYNNNQEFQHYCRKSDDLVDALCETLMSKPSETISDDNVKSNRKMTSHPASREVLELSRLMILDTMTDQNQTNNGLASAEQLHTFDRFLDSLAACKEAQGELVDMLLRQVLLMIDSTARHNSIKTIGTSENVAQFQLLLINSVSIAQIVTDKIWLNELFSENLSRVHVILDHQLCLAEQIFKFNELLPKHNPPYAFIMQRVLNRVILFALSRPMQHMSDKMLILDLLKKIHDNRTIIILNHMHSPQSAEFFVCFAYCLMKIIEDNSQPLNNSVVQQQSVATDKPSSLIERQYGHPTSALNRLSSLDPGMTGLNSSALMLVSMARKVWDAIYQSKKGVLSEAFDVSLSLPAFTLDTSLDLLQLKPEIIDTCERYWSSLLEAEKRPKKRVIQSRQSEPAPGTASAAVNILSGRLTRVVNAANFVSRVVGATAGTMASNVNLVGEKLAQNRASNRPRQSVGEGSDGNQVVSSGTSAGQQGANPQVGSSSGTNDKIELFKYPSLDKATVEEASRTHVSIIEDYIESQLSQKNHKLALHKYLCDEWLDIEYEILLRERAVFGPDYGSVLDKWCLDMTEGPRRMRKKMVNNSKQFYDNYPYMPEQYNPSNKSLRYRPPMSYDSHLYYMKTTDLADHLLELSSGLPDAVQKKPWMAQLEGSSTFPSLDKSDLSADNVVHASRGGNLRSTTPLGSRADTDRLTPTPDINIESPTSARSAFGDCHSSLDSLPSPRDLRKQNHSIETDSNQPPNSLGKQNEIDLDDGDSTSFVDFSPEIEAESNSARESENIDSLSVLRLLEKNERISHMFRCSRVQGLDTHEGLLLFGKEHFYLIDGFTLLKTREIKDIDSLPPDAHDPIIPNSTSNIVAHSKKTCAKFSFDSVVEVHKRRYLLQPIALEIFSSDGRNTLIVFPRKIRNKVYSRLMNVSTQLNSNATESLAGQRSNVSVEGSTGLLSNLIGETSVTQRWVRGELSNFQYLMNLNTIAGRSYNDLMQYPIFPWILADYTSDFLNLNKPSTFRDLSRPIGAQTSERLEQFKRRYAEWDDTETPPYHYGTFYSSAMIVASFMVRMEPFTQHFLRLQGGHFDLADRMFHSINDSWLSASKHNMADIKELIPEFFYLPEFLKNDNKYDLGIKQNGKKLNDVVLPPWAKNDAREFIRLHRCALESDYVSAHLHEWIDLIFGYKQQGQAAVDAVNVFHHLFYEGNVDIYNTDIDPIKKNAVIGFINNFGQVPKQLFKKPHPVRKVTAYTGGSSGGIPSAIPLTPILPSLSGSSSISNVNQRVLTHCPHLLKQSNATFKELRGPVGQVVQIDKNNIVAVEQNKLLIPPEYCRYIAWGHADRSLRLGLYDSEKPVFVWEGGDSTAPSEILCCTIPNSRTMITAGTESSITVWKIEKMKSFCPILNLYGHIEPITCLASSQAYSLIVSGSRDRTVIIWDLNRFTFVRQLGGGPPDKLVHHGPVSAIAINDITGDIATCASSWLYMWTINGELLAKIDSLSTTIQQSMCGNSSVSGGLGQLHILSVCFSQYNEWDLNEVILTGASDGSVAIWSMRYHQSPLSQAEIDGAKAAANQDVGNAEEQQIPASELVQKTAQTVSPIKQERLVQPMPDDNNPKLSPSVDLKHEQDESANQPLSAISDPINIGKGRKRTDTMNSEWVKLSTSSTSADTIPVLRATPSSLNDSLANENLLSCSDLPCEFGDSSSFFNEQTTPIDQEPPLCSTPISNVDVDTDIMASKKDYSPPTIIPNMSNPEQPCQVADITSTGEVSATSDGNQSLAATSKANLFLVSNDPSLIKFSKSDTSLTDSFVILGDSIGDNNQTTSSNSNQAGERIRPQSSAGSHKSPRKLTSRDHSERFSARHSSKLLPNHCWRRELYLRAVLPRKSGKFPPSAVTSITISKDHRTIYVGEASGRITSWSNL